MTHPCQVTGHVWPEPPAGAMFHLEPGTQPSQDMTCAVCGTRRTYDAATGRVQYTFPEAPVEQPDPPFPAIAWERPPHEPCQRGTPGCAVDHAGNEPCEPW